MSRVWLVGVVAAGLVGVVPAAVAALAEDQPPAGRSDDDRDVGQSFGPPPWAHHGWHQAKDQNKASWKEAWSGLTPEQREQKMTALIKAHTEGMAKWQKCAAAAGEDREQRSKCEKPLPPGLAKRQP